MPQFSLAFLTIADAEPIESVRVAAGAGYDMVGLRMLPATPEELNYPLLTSKSVLREVIAVLADTGIKVGDVELIRLRSGTDVSQFTAFFERVQQLGARYVTVVGDDEDSDRLTDNFARLCELAFPFGLTMNLEPITWTKTRELAQAVEVVETAGQRNAGVLIDALHFYRANTPLEQLRHLPAERIHLFQICDAPAAFDPAADALRFFARTGRVFPGEGELDLHSLISLIPGTAIVSIEVPNQQLMKDLSISERALRALRATKALYGHA